LDGIAPPALGNAPFELGFAIRGDTASAAGDEWRLVQREFLDTAPSAAAARASAAPEEMPKTEAGSPASAISASMSSTSRSTAYGGWSPLWLRPRRS